MPSPLPRVVEFALPQAMSATAGEGLSHGIGTMRIFGVVHRPTFRDKPAANITAANCANGNHACVAIRIAALTFYNAIFDLIGQGQRRFLAAPPGLPGYFTGLRTFRCVDAPKANASPVNLNGVAINNASSSCHGFTSGYTRAVGGDSAINRYVGYDGETKD